jgi:hypothetical protein
MTVGVSQGSGAARGTQPGANPEHDSCSECYQRKQDRGPGYQGCGDPGDQRSHRGVDSVHESKPTPHKVARYDETDGTGGQSNK